MEKDKAEAWHFVDRLFTEAGAMATVEFIIIGGLLWVGYKFWQAYRADMEKAWNYNRYLADKMDEMGKDIITAIRERKH